MQQIKYFSTFSGIGGFELGIQKAYESLCDADRGENRGSQTNKERNKTQRFFPAAQQDISSEKRPTGECNNHIFDQRPLCVGFSEIDKYATAIYQKHFPKHKNYGNITTINAEELPDFDLLVGGFPCQAFSIAGKRQGFDDTRGTLFFDLARILRAKQPRLFLFENVKGLQSHDNGKTFATIIATLDELGYDLQWQVLNSKNHGVPQNRERVFIVGHLRGTPRPEVFPIGHNIKTTDELSGQCTNTLTARYYGGQANGTYITESKLNAQTVRIPEATKKGYAEANVGDSINLSIPNSFTRRGRVGKGIAQTLDTGMQQHTLTEDMRIRRLTPTECERLQGFPDDWSKHMIIDTKSGEKIHGIVSDSQRYKCCGNAVTVNVIRDIAERLLK